MDTTIIYCTENRLDEKIAKRCRELLVQNANGLPIISVSQKPVEIGKNICVGNIGRHWLNLYKQLFEGVKAAETRYVAIAEHDCIYSTEHFNFKPPRNDIFYYNDNCWFVQWKGTKPELEGMFSYWPKRYALSQLICNRKSLLETLDKRLYFLDKDRNIKSFIINIGEPGVSKVDLERLQRWATSGRAVYLKDLLEKFDNTLDLEKAELFRTEIPNLDIRHQTNFTGPRRGRQRRWELQPWGRLKDLMKEAA